MHHYWHGPAHCWDATPVHAPEPQTVRAVPVTEERFVVANPEIMFPALVVTAEMPVGRGPGWSRVPWFSPWPMTSWPLVYDVDEPDKFTPWRRRIE